MSKYKSRKLFSYNQIYAQLFFQKTAFLTFELPKSLFFISISCQPTAGTSPRDHREIGG